MALPMSVPRRAGGIDSRSRTSRRTWRDPLRGGTNASIRSPNVSRPTRSLFAIAANARSAPSSAAQRHDLVALVLSDPREAELPDVGLVEVEDAETGARIWLDAGDAASRERFARQASDARQERRSTLAALGVDVVEISTDGSYVEPLLSYFQKRARRR